MAKPNATHIAGLQLALEHADTVCSDSIGVGELEELLREASEDLEQAADLERGDA